MIINYMKLDPQKLAKIGQYLTGGGFAPHPQIPPGISQNSIIMLKNHVAHSTMITKYFKIS